MDPMGIWGVCKMLVPESGRNSRSAWGPPFGEFIFHMSFKKKKIPKIVPSLTASAYFFEVEEDSGKGQKQVRNTKKAALA